MNEKACNDMKDFVSIMRTRTVLSDGGGGLSPPNPTAVLPMMYLQYQLPGDAARRFEGSSGRFGLNNGRAGNIRLRALPLLSFADERSDMLGHQTVGLVPVPKASLGHPGGAPCIDTPWGNEPCIEAGITVDKLTTLEACFGHNQSCQHVPKNG